MAVNLEPPKDLLPVAGVRLGTAMAGMRKFGRRDLCLIEIPEGSTVAGVFTRNAFCAAPVKVARCHLGSGTPARALLINTGSANAGTGAQGIKDAERCCEYVGKTLGCSAAAVLPFSTGVIAEPLKVSRVETAVPILAEALDENGWNLAAEAIMTTDTVPKALSRQCEVNGQKVTVTGMSKGAGMICPDMATMLAFIATDAGLPQRLLESCLSQVVNKSFNCITVDGDTSTNDACILIATGQVTDANIDESHEDYPALLATIEEVCVTLAQAIIRDGEGATKFITIDVDQAVDTAEARAIADTIAHSPLVKTALFASDPNWGRILAAVGRSPVENLDLSAVSMWLDDVALISGGGIDVTYEESAAAEVVAQPEFTIRVSLGRGQAAARIWTCDLSYDYVRINAEYRS